MEKSSSPEIRKKFLSPAGIYFVLGTLLFSLILFLSLLLIQQDH